MTAQTLMTAEQFDALPEEEIRKWELLDGELIEVPSATPRHNLIVGRLYTLLAGFVRAKKLGRVLLETDLSALGDSRLRPEFAYFSPASWAVVDLDRVPVSAVPDIAAEVISPSETAATMQRKIDAYLQWGVREVWVIFPDSRTLFVHRAGGVQRFSEQALLSSDAVPGWQVPVAEIFADL
jgi:Uma2 family endonuclease